MKLQDPDSEPKSPEQVKQELYVKLSTLVNNLVNKI